MLQGSASGGPCITVLNSPASATDYTRLRASRTRCLFTTYAKSVRRCSSTMLSWALLLTVSLIKGRGSSARRVQTPLVQPVGKPNQSQPCLAEELRITVSRGTDTTFGRHNLGHGATILLRRFVRTVCKG